MRLPNVSVPSVGRILLCVALAPVIARAQAPVAVDRVPAILAPITSLPSEAATAGVTKCSFIAYGDTRRRHDGVALQAEHERWSVSYLPLARFFHHPAYSPGPHGGSHIDSQAASIRARWMPLFRKHHVRLLLTGHEHRVEHWVERYVDGSGPHRLDQIVSGGGGVPLYGYVGEPDVNDVAP